MPVEDNNQLVHARSMPVADGVVLPSPPFPTSHRPGRSHFAALASTGSLTYCTSAPCTTPN